MPDLDLAALEAAANEEISKMSSEELEAFVLDIRTKQKVQQTKQKEKMKEYQQKRNATVKAATELLKKTGRYEAIMAEAKKRAEAKLNEEIEPEVEDSEDTAA